MAGISPTIGSAQHPMIRRRLRLAEVRMSALDGLTLLPFPRLPATPTLAGGALRIQGVAFGPPRCLLSKEPSISFLFFFEIFKMEPRRFYFVSIFFRILYEIFLRHDIDDVSKFDDAVLFSNLIRSLFVDLGIKIFLFENIPNIFRFRFRLHYRR